MDRKLVAAGVAVLGLAFGSCGSSSEPMTRAEFVRASNAICVQRKAAVAKAVAAAPAVKTRADLRRMISQTLPQLEAAVERLDALRPPSELKRTYAEIMAVERRLLAQAKAGAHDGRLVGQEDGSSLHRHERLRVQLGMTACD